MTPTLIAPDQYYSAIDVCIFRTNTSHRIIFEAASSESHSLRWSMCSYIEKLDNNHSSRQLQKRKKMCTLCPFWAENSRLAMWTNMFHMMLGIKFNCDTFKWHRLNISCLSIFFVYKSFTEQYEMFHIDHNNISFRTLALIVK